MKINKLMIKLKPDIMHIFLNDDYNLSKQIHLLLNEYYQKLITDNLYFVLPWCSQLLYLLSSTRLFLLYQLHRRWKFTCIVTMALKKRKFEARNCQTFKISMDSLLERKSFWQWSFIISKSRNEAPKISNMYST